MEEYSSELFDSMSTLENARGSDISEGTVIFAVRPEKSSGSYCRVSAFSSVLLPVYPLTEFADKQGSVLMEGALSEICGENTPDMVFTSANGTYFDNIEKTAIDNVFSGRTVYAYPKRLFGETLGSGYMLSAALASAVLKTGRSSESFADRALDGIRSILVTGIDAAGNYCCMLLEAC